MRGREQREALREKYRPDAVKVLFIGESPPQGGTFFYSSDSILFDATRNGFVAAFPSHDFVADFLPKFKKMGCYLDDPTPIPINRLSEPERRIYRREGENALARKLTEWQPGAIVVVMKGAESNVRSAMTQANLESVVQHSYVLPFPVRGVLVTTSTSLLSFSSA